MIPAADTFTALSGVAAILVALVAAWRGLPEVRKTLAERDQIVSETYRAVLAEVREELKRLQDQVEKFDVERSALHAQIETLQTALAIEQRKSTADRRKFERRITELERLVPPSAQ